MSKRYAEKPWKGDQAKKTVYLRAWRARNRDQAIENSKRWKKNNPEKARLSQRRGNIKRDYGIALEAVQGMLEQQGGKCAICAAPISLLGTANVDHDHATGAVRGLLCGHCNVGLGRFKDSETLLLAAVAYLRQRGGQP